MKKQTNEKRYRRVPEYVHAPRTMRRLIAEFMEFDDKRREALFKQAHYLLYGPHKRIKQCLEYSQNPTMTWLVYRNALKNLLGRVNKSLLHTFDIDATKELFFKLRNYTFEVPIPKVRKYLNRELAVFPETRKQILSIAQSVSRGKLPRKTTKGIQWDDESIDYWLNQAKKQYQKNKNRKVKPHSLI